MDLKDIPQLIIDELEAKIPIMQGGMSVGVSLSNLASAVANEGGIGVIGAAGIGLLGQNDTKDYKKGNVIGLRNEIRKARSMTDGVIGVNIMMAQSDYDLLIMTALEEKVDLILLGAGLFLMAPDTIDMELLNNSPTKIVPIISSKRAAEVIFKFWSKRYGFVPDAIVVEGPMAGGHLGFFKEEIEDSHYQLENIFTEILEVVKPYRERFHKDIPVIVAGGIYTGADIHRFISMGASGVQMGTRFVATEECDAAPEFKESYINAKKEDVVIITSPVGMPGRAVVNNFLREVSDGKRVPFKCTWQCLRTCDFSNSPYCIAMALTNARKGMLDNGFTFAGANAYRIEKITTVKKLIQELLEEYKAAVEASALPAPS